MSERLTEEGLLHLEWYAEKHCAAYAASMSMILDAVAELRARRAADLTEEDVEALRWTHAVLAVGNKWEHRMHDPAVKAHVDRCRAALATIERLLAVGGAR